MPFLLYWMCGFLAKSQRKLGVDTYTYYFRRQLPAIQREPGMAAI